MVGGIRQCAAVDRVAGHCPRFAAAGESIVWLGVRGVLECRVVCKMLVLVAAALCFFNGAVGCAVPGTGGERGGRAEVVGFSVEGEAIWAEGWGLENADRKRGGGGVERVGRVYVIGGIHGDEPEGLEAAEAVVALLGERVRRGEVYARFVRDMNPDGSRAGTRVNSRGVDLNRNWPASNYSASDLRGWRALSEPEAEAVYRDMGRFGADVVVVFHSTPRGPFVNFDGPAEAEVLARAFVDGARSAGDERWRVVADMGYSTPGSMGSYFGGDLEVPILTIEFKRGERGEIVVGSAIGGLGAVVDAMRGIRISEVRSRRSAAAVVK